MNLKLSKKAFEKWVNNVLRFTAPALAVFFAQLATGVKLRDAFWVCLLALYGVLADYFKKLKK